MGAGRRGMVVGRESGGRMVGVEDGTRDAGGRAWVKESMSVTGGQGTQRKRSEAKLIRSRKRAVGGCISLYYLIGWWGLLMYIYEGKAYCCYYYYVPSFFSFLSLFWGGG